MKVVVTGSDGFLGRHVCQVLWERGDTVLGLDPLSGGSVLDDTLEDATAGADAVIHLAGLLGTAELFDHPEQAVEVNVRGTVRVLEACRRHGLAYVGITMPDCWTNVYQATRHCARRLASAWHRHHGVPVCHVRAFNAFGEHQKVHGVQKIVPTFAHNAWRGLPLPVWGDGTQTVDLVHARDVARILVAGLEHGDDALLDAGTGVERTVLEVADMVRGMCGSDSPVEYLPMRIGEDEDTRIAATGAGWDRLGWKPAFRLEDLRTTVEWYRQERP